MVQRFGPSQQSQKTPASSAMLTVQNTWRQYAEDHKQPPSTVLLSDEAIKEIMKDCAHAKGCTAGYVEQERIESLVKDTVKFIMANAADAGKIPLCKQLFSALDNWLRTTSDASTQCIIVDEIKIIRESCAFNPLRTDATLAITYAHDAQQKRVTDNAKTDDLNELFLAGALTSFEDVGELAIKEFEKKIAATQDEPTIKSLQFGIYQIAWFAHLDKVEAAAVKSLYELWAWDRIDALKDRAKKPVGEIITNATMGDLYGAEGFHVNGLILDFALKAKDGNVAAAAKAWILENGTQAQKDVVEDRPPPFQEMTTPQN